MWKKIIVNLNPNFTPYTKFNSKWIADLNKKSGTIKLLKEHTDTREHLCKLKLGKDYLDKAQKVIIIKEKINQFAWIKMNFSAYQKTLFWKWVGKPQIRGKYLKYIYFKKPCKYLKNI